MSIDPCFRPLLSMLGAELQPPPPELGAAGLRAALAANPMPPVTKEEMHEVRELAAPGPAGPIRVRLYRPTAQAHLPLVVFFHGGGFVLCDLETHDALCRSLARASGCAVASVEYRLAPETRFPGALEDAYAATAWLATQAKPLGLDTQRLAVCGDSAGGTLAATVSMLAKDRGGPRLSYQVLIYPGTDFAGQSTSMWELSEGHLLSAAMIRWFGECYVGETGQAANPLVSPLRAPSLAGLPPATVITAEYDPLRDEGEAYADRLREAGVSVVARRYLGMLHGFASMPYATPVADRVIADIGQDLKTALGEMR